MTVTKNNRLSIISMSAGLLLLLISSVAQASLILTGQSFDISYSGTDVPVGTDSIIAGTNNPDIAYLDGTNIGGSITEIGLMLPGEFIDFSDTSVTFNLRGDYGDAFNFGGNNYQITGLTGSYVISLTSPGVSISSLSIGSITDMIGVDLVTQVTFDAKNIYFDISTLGILQKESGIDIGSITLDVGLLAVPVPAALPLMLSGLAGLAMFSRRRKHQQ